MGFGAFYLKMDNALEKANGQPPAEKRRRGWGKFGLGACGLRECGICLTARKMGAWVFVVVRNAYLNGDEPWMISDMVSDYADVAAGDIESHASLRGWRRKLEGLDAVTPRSSSVWKIALARYKQFRSKTYNDRTADRMVELMAKMSGAIEAGKIEAEAGVTVAYEDKLLQVRSRVAVPRDDSDATGDSSES